VTRGSFEHDGNPDLARHIGNAWIKDPVRPRLMKEYDGSFNKIDLAVATVMAAQRAKELGMESQYAQVIFSSDYRKEPEQLQRGMKEPKVLTEKDIYRPMPGLDRKR